MKSIPTILLYLLATLCYGNEPIPRPLSNSEKKEYSKVIHTLKPLEELHRERIKEIYQIPDSEEIILLDYYIAQHTKSQSQYPEPDIATYIFALKSSYREVNDSILGEAFKTDAKIMKYTKKYEVEVLLKESSITFKELTIDTDGSSYNIEEFNPKPPSKK